MNMDFYMIDFPINPRRNGNHKKPKTSQDEIYFLHGNGCMYSTNCLECPLSECKYIRKPTEQERLDTLPYRRRNASTPQNE